MESLSSQNFSVFFAFISPLFPEHFPPHYCFTLYVVVSFFYPIRAFTVFMFYRGTPDFYTEISALYAEIPCYLVFYVQYHT